MSPDIGLPRVSPVPPSGPGDSFSSAPEGATGRQSPSRGRHEARFAPVDAAAEPSTAASAVGCQGAHAPSAPVRGFPTVSVVIPCRDNESTIRATVESLLLQDYCALRQIILIGSPIDTTWKGLEGIHDWRLVIHEVVTPSGTLDPDFKRDFGIRASSSEIVSLVDSGMILAHDPAQQPPGAGLGGRGEIVNTRRGREPLGSFRSYLTYWQKSAKWGNER
jgi:hypothetical protein